MKKPIFKVAKTSSYEEDKNVLEDYSVYQAGHFIFAANHEEIKELINLLVLALNDRKEDKDE
jgi:hypothetical protein